MVEVIDQDSAVKMMALVLCGVLYDNNTYVGEVIKYIIIK